MGWLGAVAPAFGQVPASPDAPEEQRVVVTGSKLPLTETETSLPVQVIEREAIERSGVTSAEELVARLSANFGNVNEALGIADERHTGFTGVSLRGFGERSTLVLLNGRRISNYAFSNEQGIGVDLNQIPVAAIDRVEILTDGASAIYGSDAVAGVVNFILRSDYRGLEVDMQQSRPQAHGGGGTDHQSVSLGFGSSAVDGFNTFVIFDHDRSHELSARDRAFSADYRPDVNVDRTSSAGVPANVPMPDGHYVNPAAPDCTADTVFKNGGCFYDIRRWVDLLPEVDDLAALVRTTIVTTHEGEVYAELLASRQRVRQALAPTPINNPYYSANDPWIIRIGSPFYPSALVTGDIVDPYYRTVSLGPRVSRVDTQAWRALVGWRGVAAGWDLDGAVMQSTTHSANVLLSGFVDAGKLPSLFASGVVNPFGDSGPVGDAALASTQIRGPVREGRSTTQSVDAHASRTFADWRIGTVTWGFGGETRHERMLDVPEPLIMETTGSGFQDPKSGARDVQALYVETLLPVATKLSAQVALRLDRYSDFGSHLTPKVALRWQPIRSLLLRASTGTGFRAPSLPELFTAQTTFVDQSDTPDAERCPKSGHAQDCNPTVRYTVGGNPALRPETSRQWSLGVVLEPARDTTLELNAWQIALKQVIGSLGDDELLAHGGVYDGRYVLRGPVDPAFPTLPGSVTALLEDNQNLGGQRTSGIDVNLHAVVGTHDGKWSLNLNGSYLAAWRSDAGGSALAGLPRWQHTLTLEWELGAWHTTLEQHWRSGYQDENPDAAGNLRHVASYRVWSAQAGYGGSADRWSFAVGAKNLLDSTPPFSNQRSLPQAGYNGGYADPRGRVWYMQFSCRWY